MNDQIKPLTQQHEARLARRAERETLAPSMAFVNIAGAACLIIIVAIIGYLVINSAFHQIDVRVCMNSTPDQFRALHCGEVIK